MWKHFGIKCLSINNLYILGYRMQEPFKFKRENVLQSKNHLS